MNTLLQLPGFTATSVERTNRKEQTVTTVCEAQPPACIKCGVVGNLYKRGAKPQTFIDSPVRGDRIRVVVDRRRFQCKDCGGTFLQPLPGMDDSHRMTSRCVGFVQEKCFDLPFTKVAAEVGVTEGTVRNIFRAFVEHLDNSITFQTPKVLGIDEAHLLREYRCVLSNVSDRSMFNMLPSRTKESVYRFLLNMPERSRVEKVCIDMWNPYRDAVRSVFGSDMPIIIDKFHVVRMANDGLEKVRKAFRESMDPKTRRALKHDRKVLLMRQHALNEQQHMLMETWANQFPQLKAAYDLKERLYGVYETKDRAEAEERYRDWQASLEGQTATAFADVTSAFRNWSDEIFAYFEHGVTNAYTESLNRVIKDANRLARGFTFDVLRAKMLYTKHIQHRPETDNYSLVKEERDRYAAMSREEYANGSPGVSYETLILLFEQMERDRYLGRFSTQNYE